MRNLLIGLGAAMFVLVGVIVYLYISAPKSKPVGTLAYIDFSDPEPMPSQDEKKHCMTVKRKKEPKVDSKGQVIANNALYSEEMTECAGKMPKTPEGCEVISETEWEKVVNCGPFRVTPTPTRGS